MRQYFIDTNYFLRLLLKDDKKQFNIVYKLFQEAVINKVKLHTSVIVFFEIYWVLSSFYKKNKQLCINLLDKILKMDFIQIENRDILKIALELYRLTGISLEDCYNISYSKIISVSEFATFDKKINNIIGNL